MAKRGYAVLAALLLALFLLTGCGAVTLHCDNCGKEVKVSKSTGMDEDWTVYCAECEESLGLDDIVQVR